MTKDSRKTAEMTKPNRLTGEDEDWTLCFLYKIEFLWRGPFWSQAEHRRQNDSLLHFESVESDRRRAGLCGCIISNCQGQSHNWDYVHKSQIFLRERRADAELVAEVAPMPFLVFCLSVQVPIPHLPQGRPARPVPPRLGQTSRSVSRPVRHC